MDQQKIVANLKKEISKLSVKYVNHFFYGTKFIIIQKIQKLYNLLMLIQTNCEYELTSKLKKIYSKYDY